MASKKKVVTGEERSWKIQTGIIRDLIRGPEFAKDRVLCQNWLCFLSEFAKGQPGTCSGLLEQIERQLREVGHLSEPFTTHVYCRTDLRVLLDKARRLEVVAPQSPTAPESRTSSVVWRQRVKHFSDLEEKYRRKTVEQRLASKPKKVTANKEIGVQVESPALASRLPKKQEPKEQLIRDHLQRVAERRQLDLQRKTEARQLREQRLLEQRLKVQEQRNHERKMINKKRESPSHGIMGLSRRQKPDEAKVERVEVKQERVHLKERLNREKAEQERKAKQERATGGQDELDGRTRQGKDTKRNASGRKEQTRKQDELKKKALEESKRKQKEDLQEETQRKRQVRAESERRQRELRRLEKQGEEQLKIVDLFAVRGKLLQEKLSQLHEKYKRPPKGLTEAQVTQFKKREVKDIKELLKEVTEHKREIRNSILEMSTSLGIERLLHKTELLKKVRPKSKEGEPTPDPCLKIQKEKDCLAKKIRERCEAIEEKLLPRAPNRDADYWDNWAQELRGKCLQELRGIEAGLNTYPAATFEDEGRGDDPPQRDDNDQAPRGASSLELLYMREPSAASNPVPGVGEPGESVVSFCTITCRKRFSRIGQSERKKLALHQRAFGQLLKGSGSSALEPSVLASQNRILERKLAVAKTTALNKHIQKSLMLKAVRLIDVLVHEQAKSHLKPPRHFFQALLSPLLQGRDHVSPRVLATIAALDNQLEAYLEGLFQGQQIDLTYEQTVQQLRDLCNKPHLVSELLNRFYDQQPELNEVLKKIEQLYGMWKDQRQ